MPDARRRGRSRSRESGRPGGERGRLGAGVRPDTNGADADGNGCNDGDGTIDAWINTFVPATKPVKSRRSERSESTSLRGRGPQKDFSYPATTTIEDKVYATPVGTESQRRRVVVTGSEAPGTSGFPEFEVSRHESGSAIHTHRLQSPRTAGVPAGGVRN